MVCHFQNMRSRQWLLLCIMILSKNDISFEYYKDVCTFVAVSQNQCKRMSELKVDGYIHNGIDVDRYQFGDKKKTIYYLSEI